MKKLKANWKELKWTNDFNSLPEKLNSDAIAYPGKTIERDWSAFELWAKEHGICYYGEGLCDDIPHFIKYDEIFDEARPNPVDRSGIADRFDHSRFYTNKSHTQIWQVFHIYNNTDDQIKRLVLWCYKNDLSISFLYTSWYNPGNALGVVITYDRKREEII